MKQKYLSAVLSNPSTFKEKDFFGTVKSKNERKREKRCLIIWVESLAIKFYINYSVK